MPDIIPTKGRIVWYVLAADDAAKINKRRHDANAHLDYHRSNATGVMVHVGNEAKEGAIYPAMVVETFGDKPNSRVNLKVELDGNDSFWATSIIVGEGPGHYHWMPYQTGQAAKTEALEKKLQAKA